MARPPGVTTGYFQPGVIYVADKWQIALEAMIPMTGATGHGVGVIGALDFYLDDIFPTELTNRYSLTALV